MLNVSDDDKIKAYLMSGKASERLWQSVCDSLMLYYEEDMLDGDTHEEVSRLLSEQPSPDVIDH